MIMTFDAEGVVGWAMDMDVVMGLGHASSIIYQMCIHFNITVF